MEADAKEPPVQVKDLLEGEPSSSKMNHVSAEVSKPAAGAGLFQGQLQKMVAEGDALII